MNKIGIIFPHQLFEQNILINNCDTIYMVEELLYFRQYKFHKRKIAFHRASMKFYESYLQSKNINVIYIDSINKQSDIRNLLAYLKKQKLNSFEYIDTTDYRLEQRIGKACAAHQLEKTKPKQCPRSISSISHPTHPPS